MATSAAYLASTAYSALVGRQTALGPMAHQTGSGVLARSGVIWAGPTSLQIASAGSLFVSVAPGQAVVDGQYLVTHDTSVNVTVDAGGAATRWDAIILRVREQALGDTTNSAVVEVVKGTTTSIPTLPARSLLLGTVVVGSGVTSINSSNIVDRRVYTVGSGGILPVSSVPTTTDLLNGQLAVRTTDYTIWQRQGTSIVQFAAVKRGRVDRAVEGNGFVRILSSECFFDGSPPAAIIATGIDSRFPGVYWDGSADGSGALLRAWNPVANAYYASGSTVAFYWVAYK